MALQALSSHRVSVPWTAGNVHSGVAFVGNVGGEGVFDFTALGDTTNVAARLQTYAGDGTVVIGERTLELVREAVVVRDLGAADLKGKSSPTPVFELIGIREVGHSGA